jgi:hypothetical protein
MTTATTSLVCQACGATNAHRYELISFGQPGELSDVHEFTLCVICARAERMQRLAEPPGIGLTRQELIAMLNRFFATSGAADICRRCHEQGTGCCPPTCRVMGAHGCDPNNKRGKTVFCAAFVCSALLNAVTECDAEMGRTLKWVKRELGQAEYHVYEMITRVPAAAREPVRPLALPQHYAKPVSLIDGGRIKTRLAELVGEVLELRRRWHESEQRKHA